MPATCSKSSPNSDSFSTSNPSPYACISPYSMPLWTIFVKWPAPTGPTCTKPPSGARASKIGRTTATCSSSPPAAGPGVDEPDAPAHQSRAVTLRVAPVAVAAVDDDVARLHEVGQLVD